jgi:hypothetical protein
MTNKKAGHRQKLKTNETREGHKESEKKRKKERACARTAATLLLRALLAPSVLRISVVRRRGIAVVLGI